MFWKKKEHAKPIKPLQNANIICTPSHYVITSNVKDKHNRNHMGRVRVAIEKNPDDSSEILIALGGTVLEALADSTVVVEVPPGDTPSPFAHIPGVTSQRQLERISVVFELAEFDTGQHILLVDEPTKKRFRLKVGPFDCPVVNSFNPRDIVELIVKTEADILAGKGVKL